MTDVGLWSSLAGVVAGGVIATGGTVVAQWSTDRRADRRDEAQRKHEREAWAREHRKVAHADFLTEFERLLTAMSEAKMYSPGEEVPVEFFDHLYDRKTVLKMWAQPSTSDVAQAAYQALLDFADAPPEKFTLVEAARDAYLAAVRAEFGI